MWIDIDQSLFDDAVNGNFQFPPKPAHLGRHFQHNFGTAAVDLIDVVFQGSAETISSRVGG